MRPPSRNGGVRHPNFLRVALNEPFPQFAPHGENKNNCDRLLCTGIHFFIVAKESSKMQIFPLD